ncbi:hypothetical protein [Pseudomonas sp. TUM22785]|uniref:hypothetical protein n=1 Tax=Pseudomonas sp. TUM22785 TaxID=3019098 RepID=UPI002305A96D|nr:hypothetical protein [Pseudomonas sp. TUM22785]WCD77655.1 hypothetical protein PI990_16720 [Pseudomonas sp. TUM22785]
MKDTKIIRLIEEVLRLHREGFSSEESVATDLIIVIARYGSQENFDALPDWAKDEVKKKLDNYRKTGIWTSLSNAGLKDLSNFADIFMKKIKL